MDGTRFDALTRALASSGTRRGILRMLPTFSILGAGALFLNKVAAKDRRQRTKDSHNDKQKRRGKQKERGRKQKETDRQRKQKAKQRQRQRQRDKACVPDATAQTCAGKCATVINNCGQAVNCGPCECGACTLCETCDAGTGRCVARPDGEPCGAGVQCQSGVCRCDLSTGCGGCCAGDACVADGPTNNAQCGTGGATCDDCTSRDEVCGGSGAAGICGCETLAETCAGTCGSVANNCGVDRDCGLCPTITSFSTSAVSIDRSASPPGTATLPWSVNHADSCRIDHGVGAVNCNGSTVVGPDTSTTYTLTAEGVNGSSRTAQAAVGVRYCHSITTLGGTCTTGETEFCIGEPISPTNGTHAMAACEACYGRNQCLTTDACAGPGAHDPAYNMTTSLLPAANMSFMYGAAHSGVIIKDPCSVTVDRWAPEP